jgi:predicted NBD/HSP70 family sugar kinase
MKAKITRKSLWGIDMGGTKIEGIILRSEDDPQVLFRDRVPTEADKGYPQILKQVKKIVKLMEKEAGFAPARMISPPRYWTRNWVMKNVTVAMNGQPMKADLKRFYH